LGLVSPRGRDGVAALISLVDVEDGGGILDDRSRPALMALVTHLRGVQAEIGKLDLQIAAWHRNDAVSKRLATIPGIGIITATALAATLGDGSAFHSARQLAAWLGLVPRQTSSGGKDRLGRITKQGDPYLRRLLVTGATSVLKGTKRGGRTGPYPWAIALVARKPYRLATVALANKMARIVWAVLTRGEPYRRAANI